MRVLYAIGNYPKLSESYISAEIRYAQTQGVDVRVWSTRYGTKGAPELVPVYRNSLEEAIAGFSADLVHAHYVHEGWIQSLRPAMKAGLPITARGHSFEFDIAKVHAFCGQPAVKRVWLFPHFAKHFSDPKVRALPVAFDSTRYGALGGGQSKVRNLVMRTAAGKQDKGLLDFISVARLCPKFQFMLVVDKVNELPAFIDDLEIRAAGSGIEIYRSIPDWAVAGLMQSSGIYLDTADPSGHPFGMPISIAEAMASGTFVLARLAPSVHTYLSGAGFVYSSVEDAAGAINGTVAWSDEVWAAQSRLAIDSSRQYEDVNVLPALVEDWRALTGKK